MNAFLVPRLHKEGKVEKQKSWLLLLKSHWPSRNFKENIQKVTENICKEYQPYDEGLSKKEKFSS